MENNSINNAQSSWKGEREKKNLKRREHRGRRDVERNLGGEENEREIFKTQSSQRAQRW